MFLSLFKLFAFSNPRTIRHYRGALRASPPFALIDTVGEERATHDRVPQAALVVPIAVRRCMLNTSG